MSSARAIGVSLPNTVTCQGLFNTCAAHGGSGWDHSTMARALEIMARFEIGQTVSWWELRGCAHASATDVRNGGKVGPAGFCVPRYLPLTPKGELIVIGTGKGSAAMARAFEDTWEGEITAAPVVTRYGYAVQCRRVEIVEAGHPVPENCGLEGTRHTLNQHRLTPNRRG